MTENLRKRLFDSGVAMSITREAKEHILESAYDPAFGARPLKRFLQAKVETLLARYIIARNPEAGSRVEITEEFGDLTVKEIK